MIVNQEEKIMRQQSIQNTTKLVMMALLAALTCVATMIIKFPTPTFGYIHPGDGMVILSGIILGPVGGALAAGIGSMFADLFSGYASFAVATLLIKAMSAFAAGILFHKIEKLSVGKGSTYAGAVFGGIVAEVIMVVGYFAYEIFLSAVATGDITATTLSAGVAAAAVGIPFNMVQGFTGIVVCVVLLPVLMKIDIVRKWICA